MTPTKNEEIIIEGKIKDFPTDTIFLTNAFNSAHIDSSLVKEGSFCFKIKPDSTFAPHLVSLKFYINGRRVVLSFENIYKSIKSASSSFVMEPGVTSFEGTIKSTAYNITNPLSIKGGKETEVMLANENINFTIPENISTKERKKVIDQYKKEIKKNAYSHFFCSRLFEGKASFSSEELLSVLQNFDQNVQKSRYAIAIKKYIKYRHQAGKPMEHFLLKSDSGNYRQLLDTSNSLNIIALWATWCGPCIKELPQLKIIQDKYYKRNVRIKSVSLDTDTLKWKKFIIANAMNWEQLIVEPNNVEIFKYKYDFNAIPAIYFIDRNRKLVARVDDFSETNLENFISIIERHLKSQRE